MPTDIQQFTPAPAQVQMANGSFMPATDMRQVRSTKHQKLLIVLQYYNGDKDTAEDLGSLIADLERIRNHDADILIFSRFDASEYSRSIRQKLEGKFDKVFFEVCRRKDATRYPFAANQMWHDLVTLLAQFAPWSTDYYAFLPLESDCVPVHPGWVKELIDAFRVAKMQGAAAIGHIHDNPRPHLNGVAVYDIQLWRIVGGGILNGGDAQIAYDVYHGRNILPVAQNTPLIMFEYQRPTITAEDLFRPWKDGFEPAIFHGVKDASAREAVRARYITFSPTKDIARQTVFTYIHHKSTLPLPPAEQAKAELWADGWRSRGWNPVVLRLRDAVRNPRYPAVLAKLPRLPFAGEAGDQEALFLRWVALDSMGGGVLVDLDVLPGNFTPAILTAMPAIFCDPDGSHLIAAFFPRSFLGEWLALLLKHDANPDEMLNGRPHVTDLSMLRRCALNYDVDPLVMACGENHWRDARLIEFKQAKMMASGLRGTPATVMQQYLAGA